MEDLNGFELGVVLAHEAMRNGRNDGEEGQRQETFWKIILMLCWLTRIMR
jgi:hypothetical protein